MNQTIKGQIECASCPWNKFCIEPPVMTEEEVKGKLEKTKDEVAAGEDREGKVLGGMMTAIFFAGKDRECLACPVFIERLRASPDLADYIKEYMKGK